jgi:hypothetical protein
LSAEGALPIANGELPVDRWPAPGRRLIPPQDIALRGFLRVWTGKNNSLLTGKKQTSCQLDCMFSPVYAITAAITKALMSIEADRQAVAGLPIG